MYIKNISMYATQILMTPFSNVSKSTSPTLWLSPSHSYNAPKNLNLPFLINWLNSDYRGLQGVIFPPVDTTPSVYNKWILLVSFFYTWMQTVEGRWCVADHVWMSLYYWWHSCQLLPLLQTKHRNITWWNCRIMNFPEKKSENFSLKIFFGRLNIWKFKFDLCFAL